MGGDVVGDGVIFHPDTVASSNVTQIANSSMNDSDISTGGCLVGTDVGCTSTGLITNFTNLQTGDISIEVNIARYVGAAVSIMVYVYDYPTNNYMLFNTITGAEGIGVKHWRKANVTLMPGNISGRNASFKFNHTGGIFGNNQSIFEIQAEYESPLPYSPFNKSIAYFNYPPLTTNINFTWLKNANETATELLIAKDSNFNLISVDTITANNYSIQALQGGNYWWKVRNYNTTSGTYGNYLNTFNFTLTNNYTTSVTAIQGVTYELINGVQTPVSGTTVYIQHSAGNWSSQMTTGSNGYYLFLGLQNNTVYYIYSTKKDYQNSATEYITTEAGNTTTRNIFMKPTEPTFFEPDKQYVKFKARWLYCFWNCDISGATITVYKSGDVVSTYSRLTDSTGSISFLLFKTQLYRITVTNTTAGISQEMTIYPKDTDYVFLIINQPTIWNDHTIPESQGINISVSKSTYDNTHANITINYSESVGTTTALNIYINQTNGSSAQKIITSGSYGSAGSHTFPITNYSGQSYLIHIVATQSEYGTIDRTYAVPFDKINGMNAYGIPEAVWLWFAIAIMFFTGAMFTASTTEKGFVIVCAEGWIFLAMGMFSTINVVQFGIGLTIASIIAIFAYIRVSQTQAGYT